MFDPFTVKKRPDQFSYKLNEMRDYLLDMQHSIKVVSKDGKKAIIIGEQPVDPSTGSPYSFGIHTYKILGDRLEEE